MEKGVSEEKLHKKASKLIAQLVDQNELEELENTLQDLNNNCNKYTGMKLQYWKICSQLLTVEISKLKEKAAVKEEKVNEILDLTKSIPSYITNNDLNSYQERKKCK